MQKYVLAGTALLGALFLLFARKSRRSLGSLLTARLRHPDVHVRDSEALELKRQSFVAGGLDKLQVISDFDSTLTCSNSLSSWGIVERSNLLSESFRSKTKELYDFYHAKEIAHDLTREQKIPLMVKWWEAAHHALVQERVTIAQLVKMVEVNEEKISFRRGTLQLFDALCQGNVPLLIFSAGLGDIIQATLRRKGLIQKHPNVHVISNFMHFDRNVAVRFIGEPIHVYNKCEVNVKFTPYYSEVVQRPNVMLMGDSLGDVDMSNGVPHDSVLRIGFLNRGNGNNVEALLPQYMSVYDIVLVGDDTMDVAQMLVDEIGGKQYEYPR